MELKTQGIIYSARVDREGCWKLTLEIPTVEGNQMAMISTQTGKIFDITLHEVEETA